MIVGLILAVGTGLIIFGGVHRIGFITSVMVPIMAGAYLLIGLFYDRDTSSAASGAYWQ